MCCSSSACVVVVVLSSGGGLFGAGVVQSQNGKLVVPVIKTGSLAWRQNEDLFSGQYTLVPPPLSPPPPAERTMSARLLFKGSFSTMDDDDILLSAVAWKRRSGFGKFSENVGAGSSWERRRITLHDDQLKSTKSTARVCYYAVDDNKNSNQHIPRGTLHLQLDRATICATHQPRDTSQPTPYCLSIITTDGTKWKICFDERKTQMAWLIALTDIVVDESVREFNVRVLSAEYEKVSWEHGGFHRLYEEGEEGLFDLVRGALLNSTEKPMNAALVLEKHGMRASMKSSISEGIEVANVQHEGGATHRTSTEKEDSATQTPGNEAVSSELKQPGTFISTEQLYQALIVVNVSVLYVQWTAKSTSYLVLPWWQVLIALNAAMFYFCINPKIVTPDDEQGQEDERSPKAIVERGVPSGYISGSTVGKTLLKTEDVPMSEVPSEEVSKPVSEDASQQLPKRTEPLSEKEMGDHLHERWAMSAPEVDLSGSWTLIADDAFKSEYDTYLKQLGFNRITRGVACSLIARTTEITKQSKSGRELYLKGINPKGAWERTLTASGVS